MKKYCAAPASYPNNLAEVQDLLLDYRCTAKIETYPTLWRMRLLWSSRVWDAERETCLWRDEQGDAVGFALLWRRRLESPYLALERIVRPGLPNAALAEAMLAWAVQRAQALANERGTLLPLYTTRLPQKVQAGDPLKALGFSPIQADPEVHDVYFERPLKAILHLADLPPGFEIRQIQKEADLEAYAELYGFAQVNCAYRQELLTSDEYAILVLVDANSQFVAYCEVDACRVEWQRTGQRIGWVEYIETRAEQQSRGFGRMILSAGLMKLREMGAETARLVTVSTNTPALRLYQGMGFREAEIHQTAVYEKNLTPECRID